MDLEKQLCNLLAKGGFKLNKWLSNSKRVVESLPETEWASIIRNFDFNDWSIERALGGHWNITSDKFGSKIVINDRPATRRGILSIVSSVYDPLGFAAPFILKAELILQDLCCRALDWDEGKWPTSLETERHHANHPSRIQAKIASDHSKYSVVESRSNDMVYCSLVYLFVNTPRSCKFIRHRIIYQRPLQIYSKERKAGINSIGQWRQLHKRRKRAS